MVCLFLLQIQLKKFLQLYYEEKIEEEKLMKLGLAMLALIMLGADHHQLESDKNGLQTLRDYVGKWRGVGQIRRAGKIVADTSKQHQLSPGRVRPALRA